MSPRLSNVLTSGTTTESSNLELLAAIAIAHGDMAIPETQGRQTQHISNDAEVDCSSTKDKTISDFSIKVTSASETGIAADAEKEQHQCNQYSKTLQSSMNLEQHTGSVHVAEPRKKDQDCENSFKNKEPLDVHRKNKHSGHAQRKKRLCDRCGKLLHSITNLKRHIVTVHVTGFNEKCPDCKRSFKNKLSLDIHCKNEHGHNKKYACDQCTGLFRSFNDLKRHISNVHMMGSHKICPDCKKKFRTERSLEAHRYHKHGNHEGSHPCNQCGKVFSIVRSLRRHIKFTHTTIPAEECPDCKKKFKHKTSLAKHKRNKHSDHKRKHICNGCSKVFVHIRNLQQHVQKVHAMKPKQCKKSNDCEKTFRNEEFLDIHTRSKHDKYGKQYECDQYSQTFALPSRPDQHSLDHMSECVHKCPNCHIICQSASTLAKHILITHATRKITFICKECNFCSFYKSELERHKLIHSPEKSFKCQTCRKRFPDLISMKKHQQIHNMNHFECDLCTKTFPTERGLKRHRCKC